MVNMETNTDIKNIDGSKPLDNIKHERYCQYIVQGFSQVEAYNNAGYNSSYAAARASSSELMNLQEVKDRLQYLREQMQEAFSVSKARILSILTDMMNADPLDVYTVEKLEDLPPEVRRCIKKITPSRDGMKIEMYSKTEVSEIINRMQGYNKPVAVDLPALITVKLIDE